MFTPMNPEGERIRAEAILRSFTEYNEAVNLFAPKTAEGEQNCDEVEKAANVNRTNHRSIMQAFKAITFNRHSVVGESVQQLAYSPRQVTTSGCSE